MNMPAANRWWVHGVATLCALLILGAMAALTRGTLEAERERALAERRAAFEEDVRLALWRMDAAAAAWIAEESQRPVVRTDADESPQPEVKMRFEARADGKLLAEPTEMTTQLRAALAAGTAPLFPIVCALTPELPAAWEVVSDAVVEEPPASKELANRGRVVKGALDRSQVIYEANVAAWQGSREWNLVRGGLPRPAWIRGELFLLRHLEWRNPAGAALRSIQGSWIDAAALEAALLREIPDLFPRAELEPAAAADGAGELVLATFPWRLDPRREPSSAQAPGRPVTMPLAAGWAAAVLAVVAVWLMLAGLLRLSERRASFVSAVTHELRTPLTTFQLYSEMLESGAVREERRGDYFRTLRREAVRLSHLVENVLAFSRIERGSARSAPGRHAARDLVEPMLERFRGRLHEAGLELVSDLDAPAWQSQVHADPAAIEHVLFNLIDNAAKYAAGSNPPEVQLVAEEVGRFLELRVRDHGPGIPASDRRRIFRPFHKSAAAAATTRPGVGLGLALSRRLARANGGDLELRGNGNGACFTLRLRLG